MLTPITVFCKLGTCAARVSKTLSVVLDKKHTGAVVFPNLVSRFEYLTLAQTVNRAIVVDVIDNVFFSNFAKSFKPIFFPFGNLRFNTSSEGIAVF